MKTLKNYWLLAFVLFCLAPVLTSCDDDDDDAPNLEVRFDDIALTGAAENQNPPVVTDGSGTLEAVYNLETKVLSYDITWELGNPSDKTVGMHFHGPAPTTGNAPVVIGIPLPNDNPSGTISGETRPLTEDEEDDLLNGLWYLNIHSSTYPAGELRGQLD